MGMDYRAPEARIVLRTMVMMCIADDEIKDQEIAMVMNIFGKMTGHLLTKPEIRAEVEEARELGLKLLDYLAQMAPRMKPADKGTILRAAVYVAASDGHIGSHEQTMLLGIGQSLGMPDSQVAAVTKMIVAKMRDSV